MRHIYILDHIGSFYKQTVHTIQIPATSDVPRSYDVSNANGTKINTNNKSSNLIRIPEQYHPNVNMNHRCKARTSVTVHVFLSVPSPESLCFGFGRSAFGHAGVQVCYPLEIGRKFGASDDLYY